MTEMKNMQMQASLPLIKRFAESVKSSFYFVLELEDKILNILWNISDGDPVDDRAHGKGEEPSGASQDAHSGEEKHEINNLFSAHQQE